MKKLSCVVPLLWLLPSWGQTQTPRQNPPNRSRRSKASRSRRTGRMIQTASARRRTRLNPMTDCSSPCLTVSRWRMPAKRPGLRQRKNSRQPHRIRSILSNSCGTARLPVLPRRRMTSHSMARAPRATRTDTGFVSPTARLKTLWPMVFSPPFCVRTPLLSARKRGIWRRGFYAATRVLITRSDSGTRQFNFSEIFGATTAGALSTYTYHSPSERCPATVMTVATTQMGFDALGLVVKEFWPDIHRKLQRKQAGQAQ
jgi:hypothetical protein